MLNWVFLRSTLEIIFSFQKTSKINLATLLGRIIGFQIPVAIGIFSKCFVCILQASCIVRLTIALNIEILINIYDLKKLTKKTLWRLGD
jgi:hypothetical protein